MDNLCAVESDKASVELTSPFTGTVKKLHWKVSDTVKVGSILVEIETAGAAAAPAPSPVAAAAPAAAPAPAPAKTAAPAPVAGGAKAPGVLATPKVRHLAKQEGVDLNTVKGSGPLGRVLEADVLAAK
ncbi:unnamed protein product, partial [Prorocentrum cordatum]